MSEEKMYVVKNDEEKYWDFYSSGFWKPDSIDCIATPIKKQAELVIKYYGGRVVTLIEEPKKAVLTKEQAKIVEGARDFDYLASHIANNSCEYEELLMKAYVNGYTVEKEKKYLVELDGLVTTDGAKQYLTNKDGKWFASRIQPSLHQAFTGEELNNAPEWVKQLNREEVTGDDD